MIVALEMDETSVAELFARELDRQEYAPGVGYDASIPAEPDSARVPRVSILRFHVCQVPYHTHGTANMSGVYIIDKHDWQGGVRAV